jgi:hypothetical protein
MGAKPQATQRKKDSGTLFHGIASVHAFSPFTLVWFISTGETEECLFSVIHQETEAVVVTVWKRRGL